MKSASNSKAIRNIGLIAAGLLLAVFLAEIIAGVYVKQQNLKEKNKYMHPEAQDNRQSIHRLDPYLGWALVPNSQNHSVASEFDILYKINSQGIRDDEIILPKPEGMFRILALGESTIFGEGIDYGHRCTEIIEQCLQNVDMVNLGVQGFGIDQVYLQLEQNGLNFESDLAVLFIAVDDFLQRATLKKRLGQRKPRFVLDRQNSSLCLEVLDKEADAPKTDNSHIEIKSSGKTKKRGWQWACTSNIAALFDYLHSLNMINADWQSTYNTLENDKKHGLQYTKAEFSQLISLLLQKYQQACDNQGIEFLVVLIEAKEYDIAKICLQAGISCLDMREIFDRADKAHRTRFKIDPHFNRFAHKIIGEYSADFLRKKYQLHKNEKYEYQYLGKF